MGMRVRKPKSMKFLVPNDGPEVCYFVLKTIPNSERTRARAEAFQQTHKQPMTEKAKNEFLHAETIEVTSKVRADIVVKMERRLAIVSYLLPGEDGFISSEGKSQSEMEEDYDNLEDDLEFYLEQCLDIVHGNRPDEDTISKLHALGVTDEMMNLPKKADVVNPTVSGESA